MSKPKEHTVQIRLIGAREDVEFWLRLLEDLAQLHGVSEPDLAPNNRMRVSAYITRTAPLKGFPQ